jgi:hypothetical protein
VPVVPFRIENVAPEKSLAYFMGSVHWLDALTPPIEQHLQKLVAAVKPFVGIDRPLPPPPPPPPPPRPPLNRALLAVPVVGVVLVGSVAVWFLSPGATPGPQPGQSSPTPPRTVDQAGPLTLQTGLVGYWPLNGSTTNWTTHTTLDISGYGNTGIMVGVPPTSSPIPGKIDGALTFYGSSGIQSFSNPTAISSSTAYTLAAWLKTASMNGGPSALVDYSHTTAVSYIGMGYNAPSPHKPHLFIKDDASNTLGFEGKLDIEDAKWHHIVGTRDGTLYTIYIDGSNAGSVNNATIGPATTNCFSIGFNCYHGGMYFLIGSLHDVRVYNRALSAQEVAQLYSLGN